MSMRWQLSSGMGGNLHRNAQKNTEEVELNF